jgi:hypothetical protein
MATTAYDYEVVLIRDGHLYINYADGRSVRSTDSKQLTEDDYKEVMKWVDRNPDYMRTDTFIDRAEEFLYEKLNCGEMQCGDIVRFIEEFREFIERKERAT